MTKYVCSCAFLAPELGFFLALLGGWSGAGCEGKQDKKAPLVAQGRKRATPGEAPGGARSGEPAGSVLLVEERGPEVPKDPAPPGGDLASEIEAFEDLAGCVQRHRLQDPLVADAVEALGYDSFVTDSCRNLEALKARDPGPCGQMLSSALRRHCEEQVAMLSGRPELCPTVNRVAGFPERGALCLAVARRDLRPCVALAGMERATCEGLLAKDTARCGLDGRCTRLLRRWMALLPGVEGRAVHKGQVQVEATRGEEKLELALEREAEQGAVVAVKPGKALLKIGELRGFFVAGEERGGGLVLELPSWPPAETKWTLEERAVRGVLRWRQGGVQELARGSKVRVEFEELPAQAGGVMKMQVTAQLGGWRTRWRVDTWLRDVVIEGAEGAPAASVKR